MACGQEGDSTQEILTHSLINMATESWRFVKVVNRMLLKLDFDEQTRYLNQCCWFSKKIEEALQDAGLRMVNIEGQPFEPEIGRASCRERV